MNNYSKQSKKGMGVAYSQTINANNQKSDRQSQIAGTIAGILINLFTIIPALATNPINLGIVRSQDNIRQWPNIVTRLQTLGINFQTIDISQINSINDLAGVNVLFLPSVETISPEQVKILQDWTNTGGKLIASGPVGRQSSGVVRQNLRSLLGAYWAFPLAQPASPQIIQNCPSNQKCANNWLPHQPINQIVEGGVIIPSNLNSQMFATWQSSNASPAVIATEQATYLGWNWGNNNAPDLDNVWLQSILNRYSVTPALATIQPPNSSVINPPPKDTDSTEVNPPIIDHPFATDNQANLRYPSLNNQLNNQPSENPVAEASSPSLIRNNPTISNVPDSNVLEPPLEITAQPLIPAPPPPNPTRFSNQNSPSILPPTLVTSNQNSTNVLPPSLVTPNQPINPPQTAASFLNPVRRFPGNSLIPDTFTDPSEQTAPAGLEVRSGNEPISSMDAFLMRQELTNLLGRFESALMAVQSANVKINLQANNQANLVATRNPSAPLIARPFLAQGETAKSISLARQLLNNFDDLISQKNYLEIRQKWLEARQMLWQNYPVDGIRNGAEIRAVWLDRGTIVNMGSPQRLAIVFDRLAAAGINTVFFETLNAGYTIYPSNIAPEQNPLTVGWDPLETAVKLAHERGIELHAWLWTFATGNQRHNRIINKPDNYPGPVLAAHPDWANLDNKGQIMHKNDKKFYLDPANPEVRSYLLRIIGEITQRYQVDGIQLDYIRYPFQDANVDFTFGYGKAGREKFKELTGSDPAQISPGSGEIWRQWTEFRTEQINSFVGEVSRFLRRQKPNMIFSVAVFPHPEHQRIYKIQQHWEVWAKRGDVDLIVPMTYAMDTNRLQQITEPLTTEKAIGSALIVPSVKLLNLSEIVAFDQIQALRDLPTSGYAIFAFESISNQVQGFLNRTQGCGQTNCNNAKVNGQLPYRQPFAAAASRYQSLKREWSLLIANQNLAISKAELDSLRNEAEELAAALNKLAASPNHQQLGKARRLLTGFQDRLRNSLRQHALDESYQVNTWENRLDSLDMLLRYGERKLL